MPMVHLGKGNTTPEALHAILVNLQAKQERVALVQATGFAVPLKEAILKDVALDIEVVQSVIHQVQTEQKRAT
jgi:hypothetical protein